MSDRGPIRVDLVFYSSTNDIVERFRSEQGGVGRSEAVRQIVREWNQSSLRANRFQIQHQIRNIRGHVLIARQQPEMASHALAQIEAGLEAICRITGADALIT